MRPHSPEKKGRYKTTKPMSKLLKEKMINKPYTTIRGLSQGQENQQLSSNWAFHRSTRGGRGLVACIYWKCFLSRVFCHLHFLVRSSLPPRWDLFGQEWTQWSHLSVDINNCSETQTNCGVVCLWPGVLCNIELNCCCSEVCVLCFQGWGRAVSYRTDQWAPGHLTRLTNSLLTVRLISKYSDLERVGVFTNDAIFFQILAMIYTITSWFNYFINAVCFLVLTLIVVLWALQQSVTTVSSVT